MTSKRIQIIVSGKGGQGVVIAGRILAEAAFRDGKNAVFIQIYGPEARGTTARSEVIISDTKINYPGVLECDILLSLSLEAALKYSKLLKDTGTFIIDESFSEALPEDLRNKAYIVPAIRMAEENFGSAIYANMVMLGKTIKITGIVSKDSLIKAIENNFPKEMAEQNIKAFKLGLEG